MPDQSVTHATFTLERQYPVPPERVFAALADKQIKSRWYANSRELAVEEFEMDFRVGGRDLARFRMGEKSPIPGAELVYHTAYQDIVPGRRVVYAYTLTFSGRIVSASLVTFELSAIEGGTELLFTEQGAFFEGADGPQMREHGWRALLDKIGAAVG